MERGKLSQFTRSYEWWDHKTPQILSVAYAAALLGHAPLTILLGNAFPIIFGSLVLIAIYASIINDLTDLEIDIACGKSNMMQRLSPTTRIALTMASLSLILMAGYVIYPRTYAVLFYFCIALSISLYSFPPIRLKKRGIWGVISCASAEHMFPALFAVTIVFYFSSMDIKWVWLLSAGLWSFLYGLRSILWHQFLDKDNDQKSGINTFASSVNPEDFRFREKVLLALELLTLAVLLYLLNLWIVYLALGLYFVFIFCRQQQFRSRIIIVITPRDQHFQIFMLDFYTIFFPMSLLVYAAFTQVYGWLPLTIHIMLFYKTLLMTLKDGYYLTRDLVKRMIS